MQDNQNNFGIPCPGADRKCDRISQSYCLKIDADLKNPDSLFKKFEEQNLEDPGAGPRIGLLSDRGKVIGEYYLISYCPFCGGDWSFKMEFKL